MLIGRLHSLRLVIIVNFFSLELFSCESTAAPRPQLIGQVSERGRGSEVNLLLLEDSSMLRSGVTGQM